MTGQNADLRINIAGVEMQSPVMNASGTFSLDNIGLADYSRMGAVVVKGIALEPWTGNPPPRIAEAYGGMLNSVGLQNKGVGHFLRNDLPAWKEFCGEKIKLIVNVVGKTAEEYAEVSERLAGCGADLLEINISCPNVSAGGMAFGTDAKLTEKVVSSVKKHAKQPVIVKLSPNVTDVTEIAKAAESGGADALSLINTLLGMRIDIKTRKPLLANIFGGLSGPAVMPVALRMIYQVRKAVKLPIIGMGGIMTGEDAAEFIMAGASAVAVGTAGILNPNAITNIINGLTKFMDDNNIICVNEMECLKDA